MLECQVAVKDFVSAIKYLHNSLTIQEKVNSISDSMIKSPTYYFWDLKVLYPAIIDCFEESRIIISVIWIMNLENFACVFYRFLKSQLNELQFICPDIYNILLVLRYAHIDTSVFRKVEIYIS